MGVGGPSGGPGTANPVKIFANIFIAFIGAGVLGLPYAFKEAGILEGIIIMAFVGTISTKAMLLLVECKYRILERRKKGDDRGGVKENGLYSRADGKPEEKQDLLMDEEQMVTRIKEPSQPQKNNQDVSYGDVGCESLGSRGRLLVDFAIVLSQIGFCCAYLIFICKNLSGFVPAVATAQWLLIILPPLSLLTLLRHLNSLAFTSLMAQCSNLFAFGVVFWFDFEHIHSVKMHPREISLENLPFFFVIAIYCYEGAGLILSLEGSLAKEVRHKFTKYFVSTIVLVTSLYISFGVCGYLSFGPQTDQIITLNLPKGHGLDFSLLVKTFLCIALFCTYPVMMFPVMKILEHYFIPDADKALWKGNVLRGLTVILTGMVVVLIPNFADLMALVGATCCTLLAFIMPGLFHMFLFKGELTRKQYYFDCFLIVMGVLGTVLGLWDAMGRLTGSEVVNEVISGDMKAGQTPRANTTSSSLLTAAVQNATESVAQNLTSLVKAISAKTADKNVITNLVKETTKEAADAVAHSTTTESVMNMLANLEVKDILGRRFGTGS